MLSFFVQKVEQIPWRRLVKFALTGGSALVLDMTIYYSLTRGMGVYYLVARTFSLGIAIVWSFMINRHWTFKATDGKVYQQATRFLIVITITSLLNLAILHIGVAYFHFYDLFVIVFAAALIMLINFSAHSCWSYAKRN